MTVQTIGYCGRIWSHFDTTSIGAFVIQAILILVAPALYAASIYMVLGRLIRTLRAEDLSLVPVRRLTQLFVIGDVVSFTLQAGGGGIQSGGSLQLYNLGEKVIIAGLFLQIVFFGFFVVSTVVFHVRAAATQATRSHHLAAAPDSFAAAVPWTRHLAVLYTTSGLILVRSIFRVVEYLQGNDGYLISHEVFLYCFDFAFMAATMLVLAIWYVDGLDGKEPKSGRTSCDSADIMLEEQKGTRH